MIDAFDYIHISIGDRGRADFREIDVDLDPARPFVLDLFSGTGSASAAMHDRGWNVLRIDADPACEPDVVAWIDELQFFGRRPELVWASPPCDSYARESMPWCRTGRGDGWNFDILDDLERLLFEQLYPRWYVVENVRGARRAFRSYRFLGEPVRRVGPVYLWGNFPFFLAEHCYWKERLSSKQKRERGRIPRQISEGLCRAIEAAIAEEREAA